MTGSVSIGGYPLRGVLPTECTKSNCLPTSSFPFLEVKRKPQSGIYSSLLQKAGKLCSGFFSLSTLTPLGPVGCFLPISLRATLGPEWFAVGFCCCCFPSVALGRCKPGQWSITEPCPLAFCLSVWYICTQWGFWLFVCRGGGGVVSFCGPLTR